MSLLTRIEQDALIQESLPIVGHQVSYMLRRVPGHVQKEDLVSAGTLALVQAARNFDPDRGVPFVSCASIRIRARLPMSCAPWIGCRAIRVIGSRRSMRRVLN